MCGLLFVLVFFEKFCKISISNYNVGVKSLHNYGESTDSTLYFFLLARGV